MYSYTGVRHWNISATGAYDTLASSFQNVGKYSDYAAGLGVTRDIARNLHSILRVDARRFSLGNTGISPNFGRTQYRVSLGFDFSPGDVPLRLW